MIGSTTITDLIPKPPTQSLDHKLFGLADTIHYATAYLYTTPAIRISIRAFGVPYGCDGTNQVS